MTIPEEVRTLEHDLRVVFGVRLQSLVVYRHAGGHGRAPVPTLAVVDRLSAEDLQACAPMVPSWHDAGLATPLVIGTHEFARSLDAFPFEFGAIMKAYTLVTGSDPFNGLVVDPADVRRSCELQARSQLLHLREGYLETGGRGERVAELIVRSAPALAALLQSVHNLRQQEDNDPQLHRDAGRAAQQVEADARLTPGSLSDVVKLVGEGALSPDNARRIFPAYLAALERLTQHIDTWSAA